MKKKIVIIGSGLGGLTAGNLLAQKGHDVTIFEAHSVPGGYTSGFRKQGHYFESGAIGVSNAEAIFPLLKKIGIDKEVTFVKHEPFRFFSKYFDDSPSSYDELKVMVQHSFPEQKEAVIKYLNQLDKLHGAAQNFISPSNILTQILSALKFVWYMMKLKGKNSKQFVSQYITPNTPAYNLLSYMIGFPQLPAVFLGAYFGGIFKGYWCVKEGMLFWANKLSTKFKERKGSLHLNSKVTEILIRDGSAVGVIANNETHYSDIVISACDYKQTFLKLIDKKDMPLDFYNKVKSTPVSEGWFVSYIGLNMSNTVLRKHLKSSHLHGYDLDSNMENLSDEDKSSEPDYFKHCRFEVYSPSLENAKLSPQNKSSLMIMAFAPSKWMNDWEKKDRMRYQELKLLVENQLLARVADIIPNINESIEFIESATPSTFERYTSNAEGCVCSWGFKTKDKFYKNDISINVKTPIKNLYTSSSWSCQLGATYLAMKAGEKCAKTIG